VKRSPNELLCGTYCFILFILHPDVHHGNTVCYVTHLFYLSVRELSTLDPKPRALHP